MIYVHIGAGAGDLDAGHILEMDFQNLLNKVMMAIKEYMLWRQIHPTFQN